jgi:hypothetical protein
MKKLEDIVTNNRERNFSQSFAEYGVDTTRNDVMPGHYYALQIPYTNLNSSHIPNSEEEFKENPNMYVTNRNHFDMNPIGLVFAHEKYKETALILNLKVIPPSYRAAIIMTHINIIEENLDRLGLWDDDADLASIRDRKMMNLPMFGITPKIIEQRTGFKIGYAISGYKLNKITSAKLLDWDNIGELPMASIDTAGLIMTSGAFDITTVFNTFENKQINKY